MNARPRITVVTSIFPLAPESHVGSFNYERVRALQPFADIQVICPLSSYPRHRFLMPRSWRYEEPACSYSPLGVQTTYVRYPAIPLLSRPFNGVMCARAISTHLRGSRPDLVLAYWLYPDGFAAVKACRRACLPVVVGVMGSDIKIASKTTAQPFVRYALRNADGVIAVSDDLREQVQALGVAPEQVRTVRNGADSRVFRPTDRTVTRSALQIPAGTRLILFVGRLVAVKALPILLEAVRRLRRRLTNVQLAIIGQGPLDSELKARAATLGIEDSVLFLGARSSVDVSAWMSAADLLCLPSYSEGCPNVIVESLACGCPVVASRVGGIPELVKPPAGFLVEPGDARALCVALELGLRRDWDRAGIARDATRTWSAVGRETFGMCRFVLERFSRARAGVAAACGN